MVLYYYDTTVGIQLTTSLAGHQYSNTMSITLNSKVFSPSSRPGPTSTILTTYSRGDTLPDTILLDFRSKKNPQETGSLNRVRKISIRRSYASGDLIKYGDLSLQLDVPDDMDSTNVDALIADMTDYLASAITLRSTNIADWKNGVVQ